MSKEETSVKELQTTAKLERLRISSSKVKPVIDLVRGKDAEEAKTILMYTNKSAAKPVYKLLVSAMSNAENNHHMDVSKLYISQVYTTQGRTMARSRARAKGSSAKIRKRTSGVILTLKERN